MSQNSELTALMMRQWVTPLDALKTLGVYNFSARLTEIARSLPSTMRIADRWEEMNGKKYKAKRIIEVKYND